MPMIDARFNVSVTPEQELTLKAKLGKAIEAIPGKTEEWLMVGLMPSYRLFFKGNDAPAAYVEVSVLGADNPDGYEAMSAKVCEAFEEVLGIPQDRVYIKYTSTKYWGWNGSNF